MEYQADELFMAVPTSTFLQPTVEFDYETANAVSLIPNQPVRRRRDRWSSHKISVLVDLRVHHPELRWIEIHTLFANVFSAACRRTPEALRTKWHALESGRLKVETVTHSLESYHQRQEPMVFREDRVYTLLHSV